MKTVAGTKVIIESWYGLEEGVQCSRRACFHDPVNAYKHFKHLQHLRDLGKDWHIVVTVVNDYTEESVILLKVGC